MTIRFDELSHAQIERLAYLIEECGEVVQVAGKIIKHGYENSHPKYGGLSNRKNLEIEIGHLLAVIELLTVHDLNASEINTAKSEKTQRQKKYFHYQ